jgi:putative photosynthetic complex assembly protein
VNPNVSHRHDLSLPRPLLVGAAALVVFALMMALVGRLTGAAPAPVAKIIERELLFADRADGAVEVRDARDRRVVEVFAPGTNGFVRGALRGLARERKRQGLGPEIPFRLAARTDGRLVLEDPATRRMVDLGSFGPTNSGVFARLLTATGGTT